MQVNLSKNEILYIIAVLLISISIGGLHSNIWSFTMSIGVFIMIYLVGCLVAMADL